MGLRWIQKQSPLLPLAIASSRWPAAQVQQAWRHWSMIIVFAGRSPLEEGVFWEDELKQFNELIAE
jgi:hypothetical protein